MSDKGIIFSAPMVRALLAGTKTQTRRLLTNARVFATPGQPAFTLKGEHLARALQNADRFRHLGGTGWFWEADAFDYQAPADRTGWMAHLTYAPGDRLYVRESLERANGEALGYPADGSWLPNTPWRWQRPYTPSIHCPRWASRLTLTVTEVRVQRLQEISREDAIAEGLIHKPGVIEPDWWLLPEPLHQGTWLSPVAAYAFLWDSLHTEPGTGWEDNPWIVAVSFDVRHGNIDAETLT